jgi:hypothetical protein
MYRAIRNIHLLTGLFSAAFLLMYGVSSVQFAHRWFDIRPVPRERTLTLAAGAGARAAALELMERHGLSGELAQIREAGGVISFRLNRIGTNHDIRYTPRTGEAIVRTASPGAMGMLVRLHHIHGLWHGMAWINLAALVLTAVSFGLIVLGMSGVYLWFKLHKERAIGALLLAANLVVGLGLMVWIRLA